MDLQLTYKQEIAKRIEDSIIRSMHQIKLIEAGELPSKSAMAFLDEL